MSAWPRNAHGTSRCSATPGKRLSWRASRFPGTASPGLLLWNFCRLHHPRPALRLADEELAQEFGRADARLDAKLGKTLLHLGRGERLGELLVHALDHRARRLRRRGERVPRGDVVAGDAGLLRGRHV